MIVADLTDEELMYGIARSNADAFRELLNRYDQKVYKLAWHLCSDKTEAQDLTQEVFLRVWKNAKTWQPQSKLETWLYRILYNLFIDTRRQIKTKPEDLSEDICFHGDTPEQALLKKRFAQDVQKALNNLPQRQKEALILCYYQELKAKEAAEILGIKQGAVEALLFRARQALKELLPKE